MQNQRKKRKPYRPLPLEWARANLQVGVHIAKGIAKAKVTSQWTVCFVNGEGTLHRDLRNSERQLDEEDSSQSDLREHLE